MTDRRSCASRRRRSATSGRRWCAASTSRSRRARWSRCSGPTAPASRRSSAGCSASPRSSAGEVELFGQPVGRLRDALADRVRAPAPHRRRRPADRPCAEVVASGRLPRLRALAPVRRRPTAARSPPPSRPSAWPASSARSMPELSGGQQRRALIARALASEADLLVLDEPTAGVDAASQRALADTVEPLAGGGADDPATSPTSRARSRTLSPGRSCCAAGAIVYDGPVDDAPSRARRRSPPPRATTSAVVRFGDRAEVAVEILQYDFMLRAPRRRGARRR